MSMVTLATLRQRPEDWDTLFPADIEPRRETDVFELGLVLGGTVSAGAYSAGVMDFLVEALDTWAAAKKGGGDQVPSWTTEIKAVAGTSGGGVISAILGRALSFDFPPVRRNTPPAAQALNPFYNVWVSTLDIYPMLATGDIKRGGQLKSLLNGAPLEQAREYIARYDQLSPKVPAKQRAYVAEPLPVFLTLSNLRGIPYAIDFGAQRKQSYADHADFARLAVFTRGGNTPLRPDEFGLSAQPGVEGFIPWDTAANFALATAAFPVGLPLRELSRPLSHYRYRPLADPGDRVVHQAQADWQQLLGNVTETEDKYEFLAADGGVIDNEPIELCRQALVGVLGRNPREPKLARRAVLLIDPFAEAVATDQPRNFTALDSALGSLIDTWKTQARYDSRDVALAAHPECYSRFMITAQRGGLIGARAIATASMEAFGGFLTEAFRRHDYFLGRQNCQEYLRRELVLSIDNPLFTAWRAKATEASLQEYQIVSEGQKFLPIIPLMGACRQQEDTDSWPKGAFDPHNPTFQSDLKHRLDAVMDSLKNDVAQKNVWTNLYLSIGELFAQGKLCETATQAITTQLKAWDLL